MIINKQVIITIQEQIYPNLFFLSGSNVPTGTTSVTSPIKTPVRVFLMHSRIGRGIYVRHSIVSHDWDETAQLRIHCNRHPWTLSHYYLDIWNMSSSRSQIYLWVIRLIIYLFFMLIHNRSSVLLCSLNSSSCLNNFIAYSCWSSRIC